MPTIAHNPDVGANRWGPLRVLLTMHGVASLAAAVVLAVAPAAIPATVNITLEQRGFLLSYLLAAAELSIGLLSLGAARLNDKLALRLIVAVLVVFHLATGALEILYIIVTAPSGTLLFNVVTRLVAAALFVVGWQMSQRPLREVAS